MVFDEPLLFCFAGLLAHFALGFHMCKHSSGAFSCVVLLFTQVNRMLPDTGTTIPFSVLKNGLKACLYLLVHLCICIGTFL